MSGLDVGFAIEPRSDQMNADDLIGGPITVTINRAVRGGDDRLHLHVNGFDGRPYKPCKTMARVLVAAWGKNAAKWIGRSMTLYCDPSVTFGKDTVGGIRISHLSHIDGPQTLRVTMTRGKRAGYTVQPLAGPTAEDVAAYTDLQELRNLWDQYPHLHEAITARVHALREGTPE